jgi:glycosyltransferase involved in cell wall biosynthesis
MDPKWGGTSVSVPALCRAMHVADPSVRLYFASSADDSSWPAFFEPHRKSAWRALHFSRSLQARLRRQPFRMVHHHALWLPSLGYAYEAARASACPLVISPRGMLSKYALKRARLKKWLATQFLHRGAMHGAAAWHATSSMEVEDIRAAGFTQPILNSANGIDLPPWNEPADRDRWLERFPELAGKRILLFFSRLHSKKGVLPLLQMWSELQSKHRDWHLLLAGTPHEYDLAAVGAQVNRLGIGDRVTLADPADLAKPYRLAELYVLPTLSENFGLSIGEALGSATPVLTTTEAPWHKMNDLDCGRCVPLADFRNHLDQLLALDSPTLSAMGQRGSHWIAEEFSWQQKAAEMLDFYQSLSPS